MLKIAVLISGTGSNLQAILQAQKNPDYPARVALVLADRDAPGLQHARDANIPHETVRPTKYPNRADWGEKLTETLAAHEITPSAGDTDKTARQDGTPAHPPACLIVSAGFMRILPPGFVTRHYPHIINTHPALLPRYPGAHAVCDALTANAKQTGATVHVIDTGIDTGPILRQTVLNIKPGENETSLHERIKNVERPLLVDTIARIANGTLTLPTR